MHKFNAAARLLWIKVIKEIKPANALSPSLSELEREGKEA